MFADAVFVGTAVDVSEILRAEGGDAPPRGFRARVRVEETFRGLEVSVGSEVVVNGQDYTDCSYVFEKGTRYVIFALRRKGRLHVHLCTGTKPVEFAQEDLEFLRGLATTALVGSVYGEIRVWEKTDTVNGVRVLLRGQGIERETTTDEKGRYEIRDLPPGEYTIEVDSGGKFRRKSLAVKIVPHSCQRMNFYAKGKGIIAETEI